MKWLKAKKVTAEESPYKIEIPVTASFVMNEDIYDWEEYLKELDDFFGTDYKRERNDRIKEDIEQWENDAKEKAEEGEEPAKLTPEIEDDIVQKIDDAIWKDITKGDWDVDLSDMEGADEALEEMVKDFNEAELEQYIHDEKLKSVVTSIRMIVANPDSAIIEVNTSRDLDEKEKKQLLDYIDGQCSDGWGEGFEQQDFKLGKIGDFRIHTWTSKGSGAKLIK
jgi:hypothetical protein